MRRLKGLVAAVVVVTMVADYCVAEPRRGSRRREGSPRHMLLDPPEEKRADLTRNDRVDSSSSRGALTTSSVLPQDIYNGNAMRVLRRVQSDTLDPQNPNDPDQDRGKRAAPRAATVQGVITFQQMMEHSELKPMYEQARRYLKKVQDQFKVGVYKNDKGVQISQSESAGKRVLELDLGVDPFQGMSPLIRLGESGRLRYDPFSKRALLEYNIDF